MMTLMAGNSCLMAAVAANPSMPGMRTSIRMRSGPTRRHSARASPASTASATPGLHGQAHDLPGTLQPDPGLPAVRMFTHIRQRLLGHAKVRGLHGQRKALGAERLIIADLPALAT